MLEAHLRTQQEVEQPRAESEDVHGQRHRLRVGGYQEAHANALAAPEQWAARQEEQQPRLGFGHIGGALQDPAALAQYLDHLAPFPPPRERPPEPARPEAVPVHLFYPAL